VKIRHTRLKKLENMMISHIMGCTLTLSHMVTQKTPTRKPTVKKDTTKTPPAKPIKVRKVSSTPRAITREKRTLPIAWIFFGLIFLIGICEVFFRFPSMWMRPYLEGDILDRIDSLHFSREDQDACGETYAPVCGLDGRNYENSCTLESAGIGVAYVWLCEDRGMAWESADSTPQDLVSPPPASPIDDTRWASYTWSTRLYVNTIYDYEVAIPLYAYYRWYATADKRWHTLAVDTDAAGTTDFARALVRVTYTKNTDTPPTDAKITLPLEKWVLTITYDEPLSQKTSEIVTAIRASARSIE
jgi:hypothetical protein